jgi:microcystin degradation protein MlrC
MWDRRQEFNPVLPSLQETIDEVRHFRGQGLTVVCEFADGIGQGGAVDGSGVLEALVRSGLHNIAHGPLADAESVAAAIQAGVGKSVDLAVGGKIDTDNSRPFHVRAEVRAITAGEYVIKSPVRRGMMVRMGRAVVVRVEGIECVLTERRVPGWDPTLFRSVGIEPTDRDAVFIKQGTLAQAAYLPIARRLILMSSPGWGSTEYGSLPYARIPRPVFPLDANAQIHEIV